MTTAKTAWSKCFIHYLKRPSFRFVTAFAAQLLFSVTTPSNDLCVILDYLFARITLFRQMASKIKTSTVSSSKISPSWRTFPSAFSNWSRWRVNLHILCYTRKRYHRIQGMVADHRRKYWDLSNDRICHRMTHHRSSWASAPGCARALSD